MHTPLIEACADSYASCRAAWLGGADRLELCAHLVIGGTTPSTALFRQVQRDIPVKTNVLIRPRFGDFLYSKEELEQMCEEIRMYRDLGANGVVIGALTPDGDLDMESMRRMMDCAGDMEVTLHRAFDMSRDPFRTLEDAVSLGCRTVLTSGQAPDAAAGIPLLAKTLTAGRWPTQYFWYAGGVPAVMRELRDQLDLSVMTVTGHTLGENLEELERTVAALFPADMAEDRGELLTNARQADAVGRALHCVQNARASLRIGMTPDVVLTDAEGALEALGELNGKHIREDLVDTIFSRFCVGK